MIYFDIGVSVYACPLAYLPNHMSKLHEIFCADKKDYMSSGDEYGCGMLAVLPRLGDASTYALGEVTSPNLWSQYDRHSVGITRHNALS